MSIRRVALGVSGLAVAGMVTVTMGSPQTIAPAIAEHGDGSAPETSTASVDRDPHSFAPVVPTGICPDPSLACEPGETH